MLIIFFQIVICISVYRPVLSSERAPQDEEQNNCPAKERKKKNLVMGPKGVPKTPRRIGRLSVGHNINQLKWMRVRIPPP
jgi:hypothetical protein